MVDKGSLQVTAVATKLTEMQKKTQFSASQATVYISDKIMSLVTLAASPQGSVIGSISLQLHRLSVSQSVSQSFTHCAASPPVSIDLQSHCLSAITRPTGLLLNLL
jgi:hypothetical protein